MGTKGAQAGPKNPNWKGGRTVASHGYVLIKRAGHPRADCRGYVYEHILVAEQKLGRPILPTEQVHHKNHNRSDNRPENLEVKASVALHALEHRKRTDLRIPGQPNPLVSCECGCGQTFLRYDATNRPRRYVSGHNIHPAVNQ
jgi:hypothetical protein